MESECKQVFNNTEGVGLTKQSLVEEQRFYKHDPIIICEVVKSASETETKCVSTKLCTVRSTVKTCHIQEKEEQIIKDSTAHAVS